MDNQIKIEELRNQIAELQKQDADVVKSKILPLLKSGKFTIGWEGGMSTFTIKTSDETARNELIDLISSSQDGCFGSYHMGSPISDITSVRYDDGKLSLYIMSNGTALKMKNTTVEEIKRLGIKVDASEAKLRAKREVERYTKNIVEAEELEKLVSLTPEKV